MFAEASLVGVYVFVLRVRPAGGWEERHRRVLDSALGGARSRVVGWCWVF